jgi:hypothetical protein
MKKLCQPDQRKTKSGRGYVEFNDIHVPILDSFSKLPGSGQTAYRVFETAGIQSA